jgi:ADP-ribose pyrophosphatase YjhB (NUDIX family)
MNEETQIRVKAICLIINDKNELLVTSDYDSEKKVTFNLPLGGHVLFRESTIDTIKREFKEEINAELVNINLVTVLENFFRWNGCDRHEINFVYKAELKDKELYNKKEILFLDKRWPNAKVMWRPIHKGLNEKYLLYPEGLREFLQKSIKA